MTNLTGMHLRAARALLRWRMQDLAGKARVGVPLLKRAELLDGPVNMTEGDRNAILKVLEMAGVTLIDDPENGTGATLRRRPRTDGMIG